jgi:hypothetical protein
MAVRVARTNITKSKLVETRLALVRAEIVQDHEDDPAEDPVRDEKNDEKLDETEEKVRVRAVELANTDVWLP